MDGRKNNKGKKGNKGNTHGLGHLKFITDNASKYLPLWWTEIIKMLKGKDPLGKRIAIQELNKIQVKMIPQDLTTGGNPFSNLSTDNLKTVLAEEIADLLKK